MTAGPTGTAATIVATNPGSGVIWAPQAKQGLAIACPYNELLFGGAAGGGKSDAAIGKALAHCQKWGKLASVLILRKAIGHFREIVKRMKALLFPVFGPKIWNKDDRTFTLPSGATILLGYVENDADLEQYQGPAYTLVIFDELTHFGDKAIYDFFWSRLRVADPDYADLIPLQRFNTTNPGGPGHAWVKKWFVTPAPPGTPITSDVLLPDGSMQRMTRVFIPSRVQDNRYMSRQYIANLAALPEIERRRLLYGDWDIVDGAFFHEFDSEYHVVQRFPIPKDWERVMGFDWGTWHPWAAVWLAFSPEGDVYVYRTAYGVKDRDKDMNEGDGRSIGEVVSLLLDLERLSDEDGLVHERYADASIFDMHGGMCIAEQFASEAKKLGRQFTLMPSNKHDKAGSCQLLKTVMKVVGRRSRFHIFEDCRDWIETVPSLLVDDLNQSVYQRKGPNHLADATLYAFRRNIYDLKTGSQGDKFREHNLRRMQRFREINGRY